MPAVTTSRMISLTDMSDAALDALLGMSDDSETVADAIALWVDARTSAKPWADMTLTERAGRYLWGSSLCALEFIPRPAFAAECAAYEGFADVAAHILELDA